uniref:Uncharacterized protein n=1 Tax=Aegilops tauschii subsp. strangulata TaxID=200361 RepID=A0A453Q1U6_AEGTS
MIRRSASSLHHLQFHHFVFIYYIAAAAFLILSKKLNVYVFSQYVCCISAGIACQAGSS